MVCTLAQRASTPMCCRCRYRLAHSHFILVGSLAHRARPTWPGPQLIVHALLTRLDTRRTRPRFRPSSPTRASPSAGADTHGGDGQARRAIKPRPQRIRTRSARALLRIGARQRSASHERRQGAVRCPVFVDVSIALRAGIRCHLPPRSFAKVADSPYAHQ